MKVLLSDLLTELQLWTTLGRINPTTLSNIYFQLAIQLWDQLLSEYYSFHKVELPTFLFQGSSYWVPKGRQDKISFKGIDSRICIVKIVLTKNTPFPYFAEERDTHHHQEPY